MRDVFLPAMVLSAALGISTASAADVPLVEATTGASLAFARYIAGGQSVWNLENVEIQASLPKLRKQGRLRAIRRMSVAGEPEYQVIEFAGDQTVRKQVIARYLSEEVAAAAIPAASVAITPANYQFHYKGGAKMDGRLVYIFQITPRKKREGLIKGELWVDGETGAALRVSGFLVRKRSIFVKSVGVERETVLRDGVAERRVTHLSVETRIAGLAELLVQESPFALE